MLTVRQDTRMNLELIPAHPQFAETMFAWRQEARMIRHNPLTPTTIEDIRTILSKESGDLTELGTKQSLRWFVKLGEHLVANVSLNDINLMMNFAEIGYGVAEKFHGQGIGTRAVSLLLESVFRETPLRKIIAYVHDQNIPSCRLLEKLGFVKEGLLREHYVINGSPENELLYGLLKREFKNY